MKLGWVYGLGIGMDGLRWDGNRNEATGRAVEHGSLEFAGNDGTMVVYVLLSRYPFELISIFKYTAISFLELP